APAGHRELGAAEPHDLAGAVVRSDDLAVPEVLLRIGGNGDDVAFADGDRDRHQLIVSAPLPLLIVFVPSTVSLSVVMASFPPPVLTVRSSPIVDVPKSITLAPPAYSTVALSPIRRPSPKKSSSSLPAFAVKSVPTCTPSRKRKFKPPLIATDMESCTLLPVTTMPSPPAPDLIASAGPTVVPDIANAVLPFANASVVPPLGATRTDPAPSPP